VTPNVTWPEHSPIDIFAVIEQLQAETPPRGGVDPG